MKFGFCLSLFCLGWCSQVVLAQEQSGTIEANPLKPSIAGCERLLRALSADQGGFVTREEWEHVMMNRDAAQGPAIQEITGLPDDMPDWIQQRALLFERMDVDHNGAISRNEWPANVRSFRHLDINGDGILSLEEFMSPKGRFWNELFENWDTNGDNVLTKDEWLDTEESFARVDKDHNGVIDRSEFYCRQ